MVAVAIGTDHRATAAGSYAITQLDANSGFPRGVAFYISDNGVVAGSVADDEMQKAFAMRAMKCESGEPEEAPTPALGALSYNPSRGVYTYAWLTSSSWVGCRELARQLQGGGLAITRPGA